jgi:hypothetical protein
MPPVTGAMGHSRHDAENGKLDRILVGACVAIWLAALGAGVAATVALVDLARGHPEAAAATAESADTPWLLYSVIGVSAIVIAGAIPLLLRARAQNEAGATRGPAGRERAGEALQRGAVAPAQRTRAQGADAATAARRPGSVPPTVIRPTAPAPGAAAVEQVWLRCSVVIASAMGVAATAIGAATYLMAVDSDGASWALYGVAGVITVALPAITIFYLRALRNVVDGNGF